MAGAIALSPKSFFPNGAGGPLASGYLYTYLAGTTTPATTYLDRDLTTPNPNPIELDGRGEAVIWVDPSLTYKYVLTSKLGALVWTVDNVQAFVPPFVSTFASVTPVRSINSADLRNIFILGADGGTFRRDPNDKTSAEDGGDYCGTIIRPSDYASRGVLKREFDGTYLPEFFGTRGIGSGFDDQPLFQRFLDAIPSGGRGKLDPAKTYYNAFSGGGGLTKHWRRSLPLTLDCGGALMTRKAPVAVVDEQTAVLYLTGYGPYKIIKPRMESNNPRGLPKAANGTTFGTYTISLCQCIDYGIRVDAVTDVALEDVDIRGACFNVWVTSSRKIKVTGVLEESGQAVNNIGADLALGAGIKISDSSEFDINVRGWRNTNATAEIEPNNNDGTVHQVSRECISSGMVLLDSSNVDFYSRTTGTVIGPGTNIVKGSTATVMKGIQGTIRSEGCPDGAFRVRMTDSAGANLEQLSLNVQGSACGTSYNGFIGSDIQNLSTTGKIIDSVDIKYDGLRNGSVGAGNDLVIGGDVRGKVAGRSKGCYNGLILLGSNAANPAGLRIEMDLTEVASVAYSQGATFIADFFGTKTATEFKLVSTATTIRMERAGLGGSYQPYGDMVLTAQHTYMTGLSTAVPSFTSELYKIVNGGNFTVAQKG